jgi:dihydroorotase
MTSTPPVPPTPHRPYDLVVKRARLLSGESPTTVDVAMIDGTIAEVSGEVTRPTRTTIDGAGRLLTTGLVDLHTHVFPGGSYWGIHPDGIAASSGVTTWVDAGSAGAYTLASFIRTVERFRIRTRAFLHISGLGLAGQTGESLVLANVDVAAAVAAVQSHRDLVCGIKVRCDVNAGGPNGLEPLRRALTVGEETGLPVMAHGAYAPPGADEVLDLLRAGDVVTHCCTAVASGLLDGGRPSAAVVSAKERGVVLDLGHGSGGFGFGVAEAFLAAGIRPDVLSTDLHARSVSGPVFDLPTVLMKAMALGFTLPEAFAAATEVPARVCGLPPRGVSPAIGDRADLALWDVVEEEVPVADAHRAIRVSPVRISNAATVIDGQVLPLVLPEPRPSWLPASGSLAMALDERDERIRGALSAPLLSADQIEEAFPIGESEPR